MSGDAFTCNVMIAGERKTPEKITLLGDKHKKPESAQHVIEFPGGAIELSRTTDGNYWAHILINRDFAIDDCKGFRSKCGEVIGSRIGYRNGAEIQNIENHQDVYQIAVLIKQL